MKNLYLLLLALWTALPVAAQNIGIGTTSPAARLHVTGGSLLLDGTTGNTPVEGAGKRLMWIPAKGAFRAGEIEGAHWDDGSIGHNSFVGGGLNNMASGSLSFTGGGQNNTAPGFWSFTGGGQDNTASGSWSFTGGGWSNTASGEGSFIGGGGGNFASGTDSFIGGGVGNTALEDSFVGGGVFNTASGDQSFVGGGDSNTASGDQSFVGGGLNNTASSSWSFTGGGVGNIASGPSSFIGGGGGNIASGNSSFTGGGVSNIASGPRSFVGGGGGNTASGTGSFIGGGGGNTASGNRSFVGAGEGLVAKTFSEAAFGCYNANIGINQNGWVDTDPLFAIGNGTAATRANAVTVLKNGNVGIGNTTPQTRLHITGGTIVSIATPTSGFLVLGPTDGLNTVMDVNQILARNNGTAAPLYLQYGGDNLILGAGGGGNVGVGTTVPTEKLHVIGNTLISGNVGIGNPAPQTRLHITGGGDANIASPASGYFVLGPTDGVNIVIDDNEIIARNSGEVSPLYIQHGSGDLLLAAGGGGNVGIGITTPSQKLHVAGNICYTGTIGACSDVRYKRDFEELHSVLEQIASIGTYFYHWNTDAFPDKGFDDKRQIGVIAQQVGQVFPELILTDKEGYLSVDYSRLSVLLLAALQEQQEQIKSRDNEIEKLIADQALQQAQITQMHALLRDLQSSVSALAHPQE